MSYLYLEAFLKEAKKYNGFKPNIMTDQELIVDFDALYDRFFDPIYRFVYRRVNDKETVQDIVSETFLKVYKNISKFEPRQGASLSSWIYTIAQNETFQYYRKHKKETVHLEEDIQVQGKEDVEQDLNDKQLSARTKELLQYVGEEDREMIIMKYFDELKNTEIAEILNIKANNVGVRLHRALQKFKKILEAHNTHL